MRTPRRSGRTGTIKARVLAIALIPSVAIMVVGVALSAYLVNQGVQVRTFAENVHGSLDPTSRFIVAVQEERRLTTLKVTGLPYDPAQLRSQRNRVDVAMEAMAATTRQLAASAPDELSEPLRELDRAAEGVPDVRQRVDARSTDAAEVYEFYGELLELVGAGIQGIARSATDAEVGFEQMISYDLFRSAEAQSRSHAIVERAIANGLNAKEFHQLAHQMGTYHELLETIVPRMTDSERQTYAAMQETPAWSTLVDGDNSIMAKGPGRHSADFDMAAWENASKQLSNGLIGLYKSHSRYAAELGAASGSRTLTSALGAGIAIFVVAAAAMVIALRLSRKLIGRLEKLRQETLNLADNELPDVISRLGSGQRVDIETEVPWLDHGADEIGQLADAFNKAQRTAIDVAVKEAETRQGVRAVFLNIAHRSQVMVHRQLKVLDQAERKEDDPDQLQLLFQLDHLATRSRRNAENLLILGGEQAGRQWRNPVELREIIRSAIAETEQYTRVVTGALPDVFVDGSVVADLGHLVAELVDNGTAFSPPQSRVEVRGNQVGRGIVVEIEDQGLGIEPEQLEQINSMLRNPPDFSVMALSNESRIGLFVVARLAVRHGIKIALRESIYGGTRAIVLIPTPLISHQSDVDEMPAAALNAPHREYHPESAQVPELPAARSAEETVVSPAVDYQTHPESGSPSGEVTPGGEPATAGQSANGHPDSGRNGSARSAVSGNLGSPDSAATPPGAAEATVVNGRPANGAQAHARADVPALPAIGWPVAGPLGGNNAEATGVTLPSGLGLTNGSTRPDGAGVSNGSGSNGSGTNGAGAHGVRSNGSGSRGARANGAGPNGAPQRPALPRRKRQTSLAPQLMEEPVVEQPRAEAPEPEELTDAAERSRTAMSAFQQGTRRARVAQSSETSS